MLWSVHKLKMENFILWPFIKISGKTYCLHFHFFCHEEGSKMSQRSFYTNYTPSLPCKKQSILQDNTSEVLYILLVSFWVQTESSQLFWRRKKYQKCPNWRSMNISAIASFLCSTSKWSGLYLFTLFIFEFHKTPILLYQKWCRWIPETFKDFKSSFPVITNLELPSTPKFLPSFSLP